MTETGHLQSAPRRVTIVETTWRAESGRQDASPPPAIRRIRTGRLRALVLGPAQDAG